MIIRLVNSQVCPLLTLVSFVGARVENAIHIQEDHRADLRHPSVKLVQMAEPTISKAGSNHFQCQMYYQMVSNCFQTLDFDIMNHVVKPQGKQTTKK